MPKTLTATRNRHTHTLL
ncbi:unnamed protein product [Oikopleura dioica]|uniref:Uncharacterized protein n=1 Tax=Oikopleura dioica TaxID=34765 RepID=E4YNZ1_OIKDI|nr:unnamed protein product [Oikopleura dioica]